MTIGISAVALVALLALAWGIFEAGWLRTRVLEVEMNPDERKLFDASVEHVKMLVAEIKL